MVLPRFWTLEKPIMTFQLDTSDMSSIDASHLCNTSFHHFKKISTDSKIQTVFLRDGNRKHTKKNQPSLDLGFHFLDTRMWPKLLATAIYTTAFMATYGMAEATCLRLKCSHCLVILVQAPHLPVEK